MKYNTLLRIWVIL